MKTGTIYRRYSKSEHLGEVQGFNFGIGIMSPPVMTAWCYLIDDLLIDTGISNVKKQAVEFISKHKPSQIALTHHHEDHSGNAAAISRRFNIPVFGHPYAQKKLRAPYPINFYQHLLWGKTEPVDVSFFPDVIETVDHQLIPVHTPGHSKDHTVFVEKNKGWLFSGDLYLGTKIKFFRKDEVFADQLTSLKKILTYDFDTLYCAHNPVLTGGKKAIALKLDFLENFSGMILDLYNEGRSGKEIINTVDKKNDRFVKLLTMNNASFEHMIKSVLNSML